MVVLISWAAAHVNLWAPLPMAPRQEIPMISLKELEASTKNQALWCNDQTLLKTHMQICFFNTSYFNYLQKIF